MTRGSDLWRHLVSATLAAVIGASCLPLMAKSVRDQVARLSAQTMKLYRDGRYADAIPIAVRVLEMTERSLGPEHPDTAAALNNLADLYASTESYANAEALYMRALAINEKVLGPEHPDTGASLNNLAELYRSMGAYGKAEPLFIRAIDINEKALGPEHQATATTLSNMAVLYEATGAYDKAEALYVRALSIREKTQGPKHPDTATSLTDLADLYRSTGAFTKAEPLYVRALGIRELTLGRRHPDTALSLNGLGMVYHSMGAYAKARPMYERALAIDEKVLGPDHPDTAMSLNNLAALYDSMGAYPRAEPLFVRALAINEKALGLEHPDTATSMNNLAMLYRSMGAYAKAERFLVRALAIRERALGPWHPDTAESLGNLASLKGLIGSYAEAEPLLVRALAIQEKALGSGHPAVATNLDNLSFLIWATGDLDRARIPLSRARIIVEINASRMLLLGSEQRRHQYLGTMAIDADISFSLADSAPASRALGAAAVLQVKGRALDATADSVVRLRQHLDDDDRALLNELTKVAAQRSKLSLAGPGATRIEEFRKRLDDLNVEQERLEGEMSIRSAAFQQAIQPITLERVQSAIPASDVLVEWIRFNAFNPKGRGPSGRWGAARYAAYLIPRDKPPVAVDLGDAATIERAVAQLQEVLRSPGSDLRPNEARSLFDLVVQPLLEPLTDLQSNPARLLLAPDGALNLVPFAALVDSQGTYLGQRFELSYLTSGRDLLRLGAAQSEQPRDGVTVVAAPNYGEQSAANQATLQGGGLQTLRSTDFDRSGMHFSPLPGTAGEAMLLKRLFHLDDAHVATADAASEARVKRLQGPRILHIATHGFFLHDQTLPRPNVPFGRGHVESVGVIAAPQGTRENALLRSGLVLAGANARSSAEGEDGILTAAEVAQLDLQGTQLVVLSACETGSGDIANGEGVYGLRRALVLAGAQSQLVSLWKVSDAATEQLMGEYYRRLARGEGRAQALRSTQQLMQSNAATAHPYYWAAFVPIGDWRAVPVD